MKKQPEMLKYLRSRMAQPRSYPPPTVSELAQLVAAMFRDKPGEKSTHIPSALRLWHACAEHLDPQHAGMIALVESGLGRLPIPKPKHWTNSGNELASCRADLSQPGN